MHMDQVVVLIINNTTHNTRGIGFKDDIEKNNLD